MSGHNDLLHKGCAERPRWYVLVGGAVIVIAVCVIASISFCAVS